MVKLQRYDCSSNNLSEVDFDESMFGDRARLRCLREAALMYASNRRQGTVQTKERGDITATNKKPFKQKHTGRARAGSRRSPLWRGGGTIFGPHPRDWTYRLPRRELRVALRGALYGKVTDGEVALVAKLSFPKPESKRARAMFQAFGAEVGDTSSCLVVLGEPSAPAWQSMRNFPRVSVRPVAQLNADDVLRHRLVLLTEEAVEMLRSGYREVVVGATEGAGAAAKPSTAKPRKQAAAKPPKKSKSTPAKAGA